MQPKRCVMREYEGRIVLIDRDTELPYDRPPLSKEFMLGESTETDIALHTQENLEELQIDLKLGVEIVSIDSEKQSAVLSDGETINWDKLLLTTGSSLRRLPIQGSDLEGVHYLKTLSDAKAIRGIWMIFNRLLLLEQVLLEQSLHLHSKAG